jgi:DNA-binding response OmpR family regulator
MSAQRRSVLIVEDDPDVADTLAYIVQQQDFEVVVAYDAEWAVQLFRRRKFDVAFFDVILPGMNGVDCLIEFRKHWPQATTFVMTGYASEEQATRALQNGVSDIMRKPVMPEDILAKLRRSGLKEILIVDDDPEVQQSLTSLLRKSGWRCTAAIDGESAIEIARAGNFGAMILDLKLPNISGNDVFEQLRGLGFNIPTLIVTGHGQDYPRLADPAIQGYLQKPADPRVVLAMIEKVNHAA